MRRWPYPSLAVMMLAGLGLRLYPWWRFWFWGSDFGEYVVITRSLLDAGSMPEGYQGWAVAYTQFPGMHVLDGAFVLLGGSSVETTLAAVVPGATILMVPLAFLMGRSLRREGAGLLAAAFLALNNGTVYATSHAMPGSLGHLLSMAAIALVAATLRLARRGQPVPWIGLTTAGGIVCAALIATHHLSTYMVILALWGGYILLAILVPDDLALRHLVTLGVWSTVLPVAAFLYWGLLAPGFWEKIVSRALGVPGWAVFAGVILVSLLLHLGVYLRLAKIPYKVSLVPHRGWIIAAAAMSAVAAGALVAVSIFEAVPGTAFRIPGEAGLYVGWTFLFALMCLPGIVVGTRESQSAFVVGWLLIVAASVGFAVATKNVHLLSYRQIEYLLDASALLAGMGILGTAAALSWKKERGPVQTLAPRRWVRPAAAAAVSGLFILLGATNYPPPEVLGGFEEGVYRWERGPVVWLGATNRSGAVVATDHRLSPTAFCYANVSATWDNADAILHDPLLPNGSQPQSVLAQLETIDYYGAQRSRGPVGYVLLTDMVVAHAALVQWESASAISAGAYAKFEKPPFLRVYADSGGEVFIVLRGPDGAWAPGNASA